jgi:hypothetical protein
MNLPQFWHFHLLSSQSGNALYSRTTGIQYQSPYYV